MGATLALVMAGDVGVVVGVADAVGTRVNGALAIFVVAVLVVVMPVWATGLEFGWPFADVTLTGVDVATNTNDRLVDLATGVFAGVLAGVNVLAALGVLTTVAVAIAVAVSTGVAVATVVGSSVRVGKGV